MIKKTSSSGTAGERLEDLCQSIVDARVIKHRGLQGEYIYGIKERDSCVCKTKGGQWNGARSWVDGQREMPGDGAM